MRFAARLERDFDHSSPLFFRSTLFFMHKGNILQLFFVTLYEFGRGAPYMCE